MPRNAPSWRAARLDIVTGRDPSQKRDDAGFTLVEMGVAMLIMGIFMAMITAGMIHLVTPTLQTESIRDSSNQLNLAFLDLDSEVRYASAVWAPVAGTNNNDWDIEFESTYLGDSEPTCTELQYNWTSGQLLQDSWTAVTTTVNPGYKMLANDLTTGTGNPDPFAPVSPAVNSPYQKVQLMVTFSAVAGKGSGKETTSSSVTFTALNSTSNALADTSDLDCTTTWSPL